jgi:transposase
MAGGDIIEMSLKEFKRLKVIQEVIDRRIKQKEAALMISLSERQVRRLVRAVREYGEKGITHKLRGQSSYRKIPNRLREDVIRLYTRKYHDFGPTLASEKLFEVDNIRISDETLRKWLIEAGLWKKRRKRVPHRQWRERKEYLGEMIQVDGSHHDWLEGRGPQLVLMAYIDDATNRVFARFYGYEGTLPAMDSFKGYVNKYGLPQSVYLDRHTTYKSTKKLSEWEELEGIEPLSQFERALDELGVQVIHAYSPQAKGRIERLFGILQDRLIKEMRLSGIKTKEEANEFLNRYLIQHNKRFSRLPAHETDLHVRLPDDINLDKYLCIKTGRTVKKDHTIAYDGKLYQIEDRVNGKRVCVEERLDGSLHITSKDLSLTYREITERPKRIEIKGYGLRRRYIPSKDHPWRRFTFGKGVHHNKPEELTEATV